MGDANRAVFVGDSTTGTMYRMLNGQSSVWSTNIPKNIDVFQLGVDARDNLYFADTDSGAVYQLDSHGSLSTIGGAASPAIREPFGLAADPSGTVF